MTKDKIELTGKIELIETLPNSYYGNPRFMLKINDTVFYTRIDSSLGYEITNYTNSGKIATVELSYYHKRLSLDNIK